MLTARTLATRVLLAVVQQHASLNDVLVRELPLTNPRDYSLVKELCYGTLRWYPRLLALSEQLLVKPLKTHDHDILLVILLGLYQICYTRIPPHAAVSESVNTVRHLKKSWAITLINGVLRTFLRNQDSLLAKVDTIPTARYAHPAWLLEALQRAWPEHWEDIVTANNEHPPFSLRVNLRKQSREAYLQRLQAQGIDAHPLPNTTAGIILTSALNVDDLPGFQAGDVSVQDSAAQLAAELLLLAPKQQILDACAAPGGKTAHILEMEPDLDTLTVVDIDAARLEKVQETLVRLDLYVPERVHLQCADATHAALSTQFDRILIDAPCSATGIIRRHPDIKLLRRVTDIPALAKQQHALLHALWPALKPGGLLLYATCSILPEENEHVIQAFLKTHTDAREHPLPNTFGYPVSAGRQLFPTPDGNDGFYYARLEKIV